MSIPELATISGNGLPIKIIVMNNGYLGMVRQWQTLFYNNRLSAVELDAFRMRKNSLALTDSRAGPSSSRRNLPAALEEAVREPGPYLLNVKVTPTETCTRWCRRGRPSTRW